MAHSGSAAWPRCCCPPPQHYIHVLPTSSHPVTTADTRCLADSSNNYRKPLPPASPLDPWQLLQADTTAKAPPAFSADQPAFELAHLVMKELCLCCELLVVARLSLEVSPAKTHHATAICKSQTHKTELIVSTNMYHLLKPEPMAMRIPAVLVQECSLRLVVLTGSVQNVVKGY